MKTIARGNWPKWLANKFAHRKNIEIKEHNGNYYLYEYQHRWDKEKRTSVKKVRYVGVVKEVERKRVVEHGHVALIYSILKERALEKLKELFPNEWKHLVVFAMNRVIDPMPLKRMGSWLEKTSLPSLIDLNVATPKTMSVMLGRIGENIEAQRTFMRTLLVKGELLLYDGSVIFSNSKYNRLLEIGYDKSKLFLPKANIVLLFSKTRNIPVYFKLFFGSVHEVKILTETMDEIKNRNAIFVADKGFYKNVAFDELCKKHIRFIIPIPRDDKRIDYSKELVGFFEFHKRIIRYTKYYVGKFVLYLYEDQFLKFEETSEYYRLKLNKQDVKFHEERAGKIALLSNIDRDPRKIYRLWKTRDQIEKAFHIFQNILETDTPYVSKEEVFRGYIFGSYLSLYLFYRVLNLLQLKQINERVSVADLMFELSKVMCYEHTGGFLETPKKTSELIKELGITDMVTKNG